ncbi:MAG: hypothetical protein EPO35_05840 [Acidobacteria bacterium]|nr:MAG: hypothetical protein EPO35_05840 [Acidobacteriota bacterium]
MHRTTIALAGAVLLSAALLTAQSSNPTTYRGCLQPGTSQGNYLLTNAVAKGDKTRSKVALKVVPENAKVNLEAQVTHEVEVTGSVTPSAQQGQPGTLTATKVAWKADYCG